MDFKNTIVIMTSNIGSQKILQFKDTRIGEVYDRSSRPCWKNCGSTSGPSS